MVTGEKLISEFATYLRVESVWLEWWVKVGEGMKF